MVLALQTLTEAFRVIYLNDNMLRSKVAGDTPGGSLSFMVRNEDDTVVVGQFKLVDRLAERQIGPHDPVNGG